MSQTTCVTLAMLLIAAVSKAPAQSGYTVIPVTNGGTITGTVKWSGPEPKGLDVPVNKDQEICDPDSRKEKNLERLVVGPRKYHCLPKEHLAWQGDEPTCTQTLAGPKTLSIRTAYSLGAPDC
jgi:hypothetical protein